MLTQFEAFALAGHVDMAGLLMGFVWVWPVASILVGLGILGRCGDLNVLTVASYGLVIIGLGLYQGRRELVPDEESAG